MATKPRNKNVLPGFGLTLGFTLAYLGIVVLIPISTIFFKTFTLDLASVLGRRRKSAHARGVQAELRRLDRGRADQLGVRVHRRVEPGALRISRQDADRRDGRSAVRAADFGGGNHAHRDLRGQRMDRAIPRAARNQGRVRAARRDRRADLRRAAVRRSHDSAGARGSRSGIRGSGGDARREPLADLHAGDRARADSRAADGLRTRVRARARRIRLGGIHLGQHADAYRSGAAADHEQARAVRLRRRDRDRGRDADGVVRAFCSASTCCNGGAAAAWRPDDRRWPLKSQSAPKKPGTADPPCGQTRADHDRAGVCRAVHFHPGDRGLHRGAAARESALTSPRSSIPRRAPRFA